MEKRIADGSEAESPGEIRRGGSLLDEVRNWQIHAPCRTAGKELPLPFENILQVGQSR